MLPIVSQSYTRNFIVLHRNYSLYFSFCVCSCSDLVVTSFVPGGADSKPKEAVE